MSVRIRTPNNKLCAYGHLANYGKSCFFTKNSFFGVGRFIVARSARSPASLEGSTRKVLVAVVITLLTVSWQAIRAAMANPVESLRDE